MTRRRTRISDIFSLMLVVAALLAGAGTAAAQEQFKGIMERIGAVEGASRRTSFRIRIRSHTSIEEEQELLRLLRENQSAVAAVQFTIYNSLSNLPVSFGARACSRRWAGPRR
jgi:hypothetical protein